MRLALAFLLVAASANAAAPPAPLQFRITEGRVLNAFYQQGPVAAHLLLSAGTQPRVLVAFPAGNSGVGVWFETTQTPVHWTLGNVKGLSRPDSKGRILHGIEADASVDATLVVRDAVLSSVRVLRDYQINGAYPVEVKSAPKTTAKTIEWSRPRLDGAAGYALTITVENGEVRGGNGAPLTLSAARAGEALRLRITALTGEKPLTPLSSHLLSAQRQRRSAQSRSADVPELRGEVPRRLVALQHLFRPRHVDVAALAAAGPGAGSAGRRTHGSAATSRAERRSRARRRHRRIRRPASSQAGRRRERCADLRLQHDRRRLHAGAGRGGVPDRPRTWPHACQGFSGTATCRMASRSARRWRATSPGSPIGAARLRRRRSPPT